MFLDERLSIEAKGVLGFLLSRPHKWQVRLDHVGRTLRIGRKKLQRIFRELISAGYVTREQRRIDHRTIGRKSRYHAKNCCFKAQKFQPIL